MLYLSSKEKSRSQKIRDLCTENLLKDDDDDDYDDDDDDDDDFELGFVLHLAQIMQLVQGQKNLTQKFRLQSDLVIWI